MMNRMVATFREKIQTFLNKKVFINEYLHIHIQIRIYAHTHYTHVYTYPHTFTLTNAHILKKTHEVEAWMTTEIKIWKKTLSETDKVNEITKNVTYACIYIYTDILMHFYCIYTHMYTHVHRICLTF